MNGVGLGLVVAIAAGISAGTILLLLPVLERYALAHPNARSSHRKSTPQCAGIAVVGAGLAVAMGALAVGPNAWALSSSLWTVFAAATFIAIVGVIDDIRTIDVAPRLLLQTLAVAVMIASLPAELRVVPVLPWWIERALLLIACLWFVNLTNFMDGIDWMTVAEFVPVAIGLALIGLLGALPMPGIIVALSLAGALIGFAPFNRPVARIFLGDVGSLPIGLLVGWLLVELAGRGHVAAAMILPLYYLADATLTLFRRIGRREAFWKAHRSHFYQVATDRGFSVGAIVARVFAVNVLLAVIVIASVLWPSRIGDAVAFAVAVVLTGWLLRTLAHGKS
jgi:UDP-N-acetylmuramyl pentapeptide phosphotransferase/UDP-N-acetylglucosamine-1-phosphate transferase